MPEVILAVKAFLAIAAASAIMALARFLNLLIFEFYEGGSAMCSDHKNGIKKEVAVTKYVVVGFGIVVVLIILGGFIHEVGKAFGVWG